MRQKKTSEIRSHTYNAGREREIRFGDDDLGIIRMILLLGAEPDDVFCDSKENGERGQGEVSERDEREDKGKPRRVQR